MHWQPLCSTCSPYEIKLKKKSQKNNHKFFDKSIYLMANIQKPLLSFFFFLLGFTPWKTENPLKACSYKKKKHTKINAYRESLQKEPTINMCLLILDLKPFSLQVKGKHSISRESQSLVVRGKKLLTSLKLLTFWNGDGKIMQSIRIVSRPPSRKKKLNQLSQF